MNYEFYCLLKCRPVIENIDLSGINLERAIFNSEQDFDEKLRASTFNQM